MAIDSPLLNETGCYVQEHPLIDKYITITA